MKNKITAIIIASVLVFVVGSILSSYYPILAHEENSVVIKIKPVPGETHHLEVKPESKEGYRLPYMKVMATIVDQETRQEKIVEFHPMFGGNFHYGVNVALQPKAYLIRFHLDSPTFTRGHTRKNQWLNPIEAEFTFDAAASFEKSIMIGSRETEDMKILFEAEHAEEMFTLAGTEKEHSAHGESTMPPEEKTGLTHQFQELLPFEHVREGHWLAVILSILLWASLIYTIYFLMQKLRKPQ